MAHRPGLDEASVIRAAAALADSEGLEALNLAHLAETLGVRTPSLYNHVKGLEGVRHGLALYGVRELGASLGRAAIGQNGATGIFAIATAYRHFAKEHPGLYAATLRAPDPDDDALIAASDEILAIIRAVLAPYGLHDAAEIHAMRALRSLAHGFVSLENVGGFGIPLDIDTSYHMLVRLFVVGLEQRQALVIPTERTNDAE